MLLSTISKPLETLQDYLKKHPQLAGARAIEEVLPRIKSEDERVIGFMELTYKFAKDIDLATSADLVKIRDGFRSTGEVLQSLQGTLQKAVVEAQIKLGEEEKELSTLNARIAPLRRQVEAYTEQINRLREAHIPAAAYGSLAPSSADWGRVASDLETQRRRASDQLAPFLAQVAEIEPRINDLNGLISALKTVITLTQGLVNTVLFASMDLELAGDRIEHIQKDLSGIASIMASVNRQFVQAQLQKVVDLLGGAAEETNP
ncbi:hypothetical protein ACIQ6V_33295 [Streptomyces sp. NPDC096198]|uniref:hypothetical protein n=1 Tax=Streptomyces sp. NPDC096198 TaxID=3366080 RepID=UPI003814590A